MWPHIFGRELNQMKHSTPNDNAMNKTDAKRRPTCLICRSAFSCHIQTFRLFAVVPPIYTYLTNYLVFSLVALLNMLFSHHFIRIVF